MGFRPPIDNLPVVHVVSAGKTVPGEVGPGKFLDLIEPRPGIAFRQGSAVAPYEISKPPAYA